ncbi:MAG: hypothetical protein HY040_18700 [Planctomycetes bacterium]|nr:hypothetical protein [Planctomycetota bacterium]
MNRFFTIIAMAGLISFVGAPVAYAQHRTGGNTSGGSANGGSATGSSNSGNTNSGNTNGGNTNNGASNKNANGAKSVVLNTNTTFAKTNAGNMKALNTKVVTTKTVNTTATPITTFNKSKTTKLTSTNTAKITASSVATKHIVRRNHWRHHRHHQNWYFAFYGSGTIYRGCWWPVYYPSCFPPIYVGDQDGTGIAQTTVDAASEEATETESESETASETTSAETTFQVERQLKVVNETKEEVEFFILMHTLDEGKWSWEPAAPGSPKETISFVLAPGEAFVVGEDNELFTANKIRIWAKSATKEWRQYEGTDLWLIDLDAVGQRRYQSAEMQTYTFRLPE